MSKQSKNNHDALVVGDGEYSLWRDATKMNWMPRRGRKTLGYYRTAAAALGRLLEEAEFSGEPLAAVGLAELKAMLDDNDMRRNTLAERLGGLVEAEEAARTLARARGEAIRHALSTANNRWNEWGSRAESVADILEDAP